MGREGRKDAALEATVNAVLNREPGPRRAEHSRSTWRTAEAEETWMLDWYQCFVVSRYWPYLGATNCQDVRLHLPCAKPLHRKVPRCSCRIALFDSDDRCTTADMFENVCAIPLDYDLFAQAIHPEEPIVAVGLASGHVQTYRLPGSGNDSDDAAVPASGYGHIDTVWKTRRHKGSCRTLGFSVDGSQLYSAGTDGIVKVADSTTGRVTAKIAVPLDPYAQTVPS